MSEDRVGKVNWDVELLVLALRPGLGAPSRERPAEDFVLGMPLRLSRELLLSRA